MTDYLVGRVQDVLGGAVILLQLKDFRVGKYLFKIQDIADIGAPEFINGLIVVPHHAEIPVPGRQPAHKLKLHGVGVLILIHHNIAESFLIVVQRLRTVPEQFHGFHQQIVKIQSIVLFQLFLISPVDFSYPPVFPAGHLFFHTRWG